MSLKSVDPFLGIEGVHIWSEDSAEYEHNVSPELVTREHHGALGSRSGDERPEPSTGTRHHGSSARTTAGQAGRNGMLFRPSRPGLYSGMGAPAPAPLLRWR